jgi:predicted DCC family thiol-disulfide oxidoreductase YuxK
MTITYPPKVAPQDQIILFDGVCKLCNGWSKFIIRVDTKHIFKLCSVQSSEGQAILKWFNFPTDYFETMLLIQGNKALTKSDSFLEIVKQLSFPWKTLYIAKVLPRIFRDWLYDRIALNRYKIFGKYDYCTLPAPDHLSRFLGE